MSRKRFAHEQVTEIILRAFFNVRGRLKGAYPESHFQRALVIELRHLGLRSELEVEYAVRYRDEVVGEHRADIVVEELVIVEVKRVAKLLHVHSEQLQCYLQASGYDVGLLLNFSTGEIRRLDRAP